MAAIRTTEKIEKRITSLFGVKMVISRVEEFTGKVLTDRWFNVYTADEYAYGKGLRYAEFEGCALFEAEAQCATYSQDYE